MYESILKELSRVNLDSSSGATLFIKRKDGILSKKYMYSITAMLNHAILKEFIEMSVELSTEKIEAILLIIHCSSQGEPTHDILLRSGQPYKSYEVLI